MEHFKRSTTKIYWMKTTIVSFDPIYIRFAFSNFMGKILSMARAMSMSFYIVNTPSIEYSNIANFNKWKSLIKDKKMLDAMECTSTGNDNFATKVISMENVEKKNVDEVRRKNQTYFFSKLLGD